MPKLPTLTTVSLFLLLTAGLAAQSAPLVQNVTASTSVGLYQKCEVTFNLTTVATNLYWPYDTSPSPGVPAGVGVSVDGLFSKDNWQTTIVQPAFIYQDYTRDDAAFPPYSWLYPKGTPVWKIRFSPTTVGAWKFRIRATDSSGTTTSPEQSFQCVTSTSHGFVKVSKTDTRYFELSDGTYVPMVGLFYFNRNMGDTEKAYAQLAGQGINLIRAWWQSSDPVYPLFGAGGQGGDSAWNNLTYSSTYIQPGHLVSVRVPNASDLWAGLYTQPFVVNGRNYRLKATVKTVGIAGTGSYGVRLVAQGTASTSTKLTGSTDWTEIHLDFTAVLPAIAVGLGMDNVTGGQAYCSGMSLREDLGSGNYGPELLIRPDFQANNSLPQSIAYRIDDELDTAANDGLCIKAVIMEKGDSFFGSIGPNGTWSGQSDSNVYAADGHANRTYEEYYWRYLIARWGYSTALHSVEFCNEGDPVSQEHRDGLQALKDYFSANDPNQHMVSTSNWHSFPPLTWKGGGSDYADVHMYVGQSVPSGGVRLWPGWDGGWTQPAVDTSVNGWDGFSIDATGGHNGSAKSLKMAIPPAAGYNASDYRDCNAWFSCGAPTGHRIRVSFWAKSQGTQNFAGGATYMVPAELSLQFSQDGGDFAGYPSDIPGATGTMAVDWGTYDWRQCTYEFVVPSTALPNSDGKLPEIMWVHPSHRANGGASTGYVWFDDVNVEDLTTGLQINYNGGFEQGFNGTDTMNYDVAAGHSSFSRLTRGFGFNKPTIRGEEAIVCPQRFSNPYKGFGMEIDDQLLIDDTAGIWWKKLVWSNMDPGGLYDIYWTFALVFNRNYTYGKAYQSFMAGVPLSNGKYKDVNATVSNPKLRVLGQKDLTNNRAVVWIDNSDYTWYAVVAHSYQPEPWKSSATYANGSTCGSAARDFTYKSLQDNNVNHPVTDTSWWQPMGAFSAANNPPLPAAVSGTATIGGFADGTYKVESWDTTTGTILQTSTVSCVGGNIVLSVTNLQSDVACKIYPSSTPSDTLPPSVSITSPAQGYSTTAGTVNLGGTASDNVGVSSVTWSSSRGGSGTCTGTTAWSASAIALQSGSNVITVTARDAAGNTATDTLTVTYNSPDTTVPTVTVSTPTSSATYTTTASTLNIGGSASDNVGVSSAAWSNNRGGSGTCAGTTAWSASAIALQSGSNVITVTARDAAGNTATDTLTVTCSTPDTTVPTVTVSTPTSSATYTTTASTLNIGGSASDNIGVSSVAWSNNRGGSGTCTGTTAWSASAIVLQSGSNVITVTARDVAGNVATDTLTVTCSTPDTTVPTVIISSPTSNTTFSTSALTLVLGGSVSDNVGVASVTWSNSRGGSGTCTGTTAWSTSAITLQSGANVIAVTVQDAAGNKSKDSITVTRVAKPTVYIISPTIASTYTSSTATLRLAGRSTGLGVTKVLWVNDVGSSGSVTTSGQWTIPSIALQPGKNVITVTVRDSSNTVATDTLTCTYLTRQRPAPQ